MDLNVPITPHMLLNAVECAHDTLLEQMAPVIALIPEGETITIQALAKRLGFDLTEFNDTLAAHRFFIDTAKEALRYASYSARTQR